MRRGLAKFPADPETDVVAENCASRGRSDDPADVQRMLGARIHRSGDQDDYVVIEEIHARRLPPAALERLRVPAFTAGSSASLRRRATHAGPMFTASAAQSACPVGHLAQKERHGSLNAKDNFQFERTIVGFRGRNVVDLRRKQ
jgi:hypothetical protein